MGAVADTMNSASYRFLIKGTDGEDRAVCTINSLDEAVDYYERVLKYYTDDKITVEQTVHVENTTNVSDAFRSIHRKRLADESVQHED